MTVFDSLGIVHVGVFCVAVLLLNLTPGPDTAFIVGQSVAHGRRFGLASVLGISVGCLVHTAAIAFGLSALIAASTEAFLVIRVVGAIYLTLLGARLIVASLRGDDEAAPVAARPGASSMHRAFSQGLVTNVLNPKVVLFFLSFLPQFVAASSASKGWAFAALGGILFSMSTVYNASVAWVAGGITRRMRSMPRVKRWLDRSIGAAFVALGARIAFRER